MQSNTVYASRRRSAWIGCGEEVSIGFLVEKCGTGLVHPAFIGLIHGKRCGFLQIVDCLRVGPGLSAVSYKLLTLSLTIIDAEQQGLPTTKLPLSPKSMG